MKRLIRFAGSLRLLPAWPTLLATLLLASSLCAQARHLTLPAWPPEHVPARCDHGGDSGRFVSVRQSFASAAKFGAPGACFVRPPEWLTALGASPGRLPSAAAQEARPQSPGARFWFLTGLAAALTVSDIEATQSCLSRGRCREANPFMPTRRAQVYAFQIPAFLAFGWLSLHLETHGHRRLAVLPLLSLITVHAVGTVLALHANHVPSARP